MKKLLSLLLTFSIFAAATIPAGAVVDPVVDKLKEAVNIYTSSRCSNYYGDANLLFEEGEAPSEVVACAVTSYIHHEDLNRYIYRVDNGRRSFYRMPYNTFMQYATCHFDYLPNFKTSDMYNAEKESLSFVIDDPLGFDFYDIIGYTPQSNGRYIVYIAYAITKSYNKENPRGEKYIDWLDESDSTYYQILGKYKMVVDLSGEYPKYISFSETDNFNGMENESKSFSYTTGNYETHWRSITAKAGVLPIRTQASIQDISNTPDSYWIAEYLDNNNSRFSSFIVSVTCNNDAIQPDGNVSVCLTVPYDYDTSKCVVYSLDNNNEKIYYPILETYNGYIYDDYIQCGTICFDVNQFDTSGKTTYVIEEYKNFLRGDADGNSVINVSDIIYIKSLIMDERYKPTADMNGDNTVNVSDIINLKSFIMSQS